MKSLTGSRTIEALGASSSSSRVFSKSSPVNSLLGNMVAREKLPYLFPTSYKTDRQAERE